MALREPLKVVAAWRTFFQLIEIRKAGVLSLKSSQETVTVTFVVQGQVLRQATDSNA